MKIDIFTCQFGMGHNAQAQALKSQLCKYHEVNIWDVCERLFPKWNKTIYYAYSKLVQRQGLLLSFYHHLRLTERERVGQLSLLKQISFAYLDGQELADAWIATHSATAYFLAAYKRERQLSIPLVTCITDINPHELWINEGTDLYLVAAAETKELLVKKGVPHESVVVYGLAGNKANLSRETIMPKDKLHILISGGGLGLLPKDLKFYRALTLNGQAEVRVLCGKNELLKKKIEKAKIPHVKAYPFVQDMTSQLSWAHVYVSKPGGLSTFEAIYAETPILYLKPFLIQESHNGQFITKEGIGWQLDSENLLSIKTWDELNLCHQNIRRIKESFEPERFLDWLDNPVVGVAS